MPNKATVETLATDRLPRVAEQENVDAIDWLDRSRKGRGER
jgi:hypothetical protein